MDTLERRNNIVSSKNPDSQNIIEKAHKKYLEKYYEHCKKAIEKKKDSNAEYSIKNPPREVKLTLENIEKWNERIKEKKQETQKKQNNNPNHQNTGNFSPIWSKEDHKEGFRQKDQVFSTREYSQQKERLVVTTKEYRQRFEKKG